MKRPLTYERLLFQILLCTTMPAILFGCDQQAPQIGSKPAHEILSVHVTTLSPQSWSQDIHTFGSLESTEEVSISVDYTGTVSSVNFEEGQTISVGQKLAEFDKRKQLLRLEQAAANANRSRAQLEQAQSTHERHRRLMSNNLLSKEVFKKSQAEFEGARAGLQQALAAQALAQQELEQTIIISPVDGIVQVRAVEPGQTVLPGTSLAIVQVSETMRVVTYVTEREINSLRVGDAATVTTASAPGKIYPARIALIGSSADPRTGNFTIKLAVNNQQGLLRQGMSARVHLQGIRTDNILLLPRNALVDRNRRRVVFKVKDGHAMEVEPVLGVSAGDQIPVLAGLQAGDQIILDRLELIINGQPVATLESEPDSNSAKNHSSQNPSPQNHSSQNHSPQNNATPDKNHMANRQTSDNTHELIGKTQ